MIAHTTRVLRRDAPRVTGCRRASVLRRETAHRYFALPGFEARLSPKFRANLRRCERKAGGLELERIAVPDRAAFDAALAGLDLRGRRDGLTFMPEMRAYAGKRFAIAGELTTVFELDRWIATRAPIYILDGLHCTGAITAARGPCDRGCALMWHPDWLNLEPELPGRGGG